MAQTYIGAAIRRKEDRRFLTGTGQFVDDVTLPHMLHAAMVRSPHAHARILHIDASAARRMPGVVAVLTYQSLFEKYQAASRLSIKRVIATYTKVSLVVGNSS